MHPSQVTDWPFEVTISDWNNGSDVLAMACSHMLAMWNASIRPVMLDERQPSPVRKVILGMKEILSSAYFACCQSFMPFFDFNGKGQFLYRHFD